MAIVYTLHFAEGEVSSSDFRLFERRVAAWMARQWRHDLCHPEADQSAMDDLRAGEAPQPLSLRITKAMHVALQLPELDQRNEAIIREFIKDGRRELDHDRSLEIVLHATEVGDIEKAEASFVELMREFPAVSWERRLEDRSPSHEGGFWSDLDS